MVGSQWYNPMIATVDVSGEKWIVYDNVSGNEVPSFWYL